PARPEAARRQGDGVALEARPVVAVSSYPRCPFAGDRRTPPVETCSGFLAVRVPLGPLEEPVAGSATSCAHLGPLPGRRGVGPCCHHPGGIPGDAAELLAALRDAGRGRRLGAAAAAPAGGAPDPV